MLSELQINFWLQHLQSDVTSEWLFSSCCFRSCGSFRAGFLSYARHPQFVTSPRPEGPPCLTGHSSSVRTCPRLLQAKAKVGLSLPHPHPLSPDLYSENLRHNNHLFSGFPVFRFSGFPVFRFSGFPVFRFSGEILHAIDPVKG